MSGKFAAVASDNGQLVICGLGETYELALEDARRQDETVWGLLASVPETRQPRPGEFGVFEIDAGAAELVEAGSRAVDGRNLEIVGRRVRVVARAPATDGAAAVAEAMLLIAAEVDATARLLWVDLETTGLADSDQILELAAVVTDLRGQIVSPWFERVLWVSPDRPIVAKVAAMHGGPGRLLERCLDAPMDYGTRELDSELAAFVTHHRDGFLYLAGSSVHFDRAHLARATPEALSWLSYRQVDVSSLLIAASAAGFQFRRREAAHRGREDLEGSIASYRRVLELFRGVEGVVIK